PTYSQPLPQKPDTSKWQKGERVQQIIQTKGKHLLPTQLLPIAPKAQVYWKYIEKQEQDQPNPEEMFDDVSIIH
ncbi:MAG: hypothetical protein WAN99_09505, partial [Methanoculleus sp.]